MLPVTGSTPHQHVGLQIAMRAKLRVDELEEARPRRDARHLLMTYTRSPMENFLWESRMSDFEVVVSPMNDIPSCPCGLPSWVLNSSCTSRGDLSAAITLCRHEMCSGPPRGRKRSRCTGATPSSAAPSARKEAFATRSPRQGSTALALPQPSSASVRRRRSEPPPAKASDAQLP